MSDKKTINLEVENFAKSKREELEKMIPDFVNDRKFTDIVLNFYERGIREGTQMILDRMVELKFKIGDWIVINGFTILITDVRNDLYDTIFENSENRIYDTNVIDKDAHLWTIQDAKDGDVLVCESGWTCIFKTLVNEETFGSYCFMDSTGWFYELGSECHTLKEEFVKAYNGKIHPATKEQRDTLWSKMKEVGYEWDSEKKELKEIVAPKSEAGDDEEDDKEGDDKTENWKLTLARQRLGNEARTWKTPKVRKYE